MEELLFALENSSSKAPGPDNIPTIFIKEVPLIKLTKLLGFYYFVWENGFPYQWRTAIVIPILKTDKLTTSFKSYRSIALISCLCKVVECIVNERLQQFLEGEQYLARYQIGFWTGHSTMDALARLESDVRKVLI